MRGGGELSPLYAKIKRKSWIFLLFSGKEGTPLNKRNEYDFIEELLLQGQDSKAKFDLINQIRELRDWQNDPAHFKPKEEEIKTTREIINQAKANGLSVKETRKAVEANKALKEAKLKQEIKEAKEKHNALKESEKINSQMNVEEENLNNPIISSEKIYLDDENEIPNLNAKEESENISKEEALNKLENIKGEEFTERTQYKRLFKELNSVENKEKFH